MATEQHGLLAEFGSPEELLKAAREARDAGYARLDAYAPHPVEGLAEALGKKKTGIAPAMLVGGIAGGVGAYAMQSYAMVYDYPLNIGGRPLHSWPAYIPITFELTVLSASLVGMFTMLLLNRLPRLHHPVFNVERFERASIDGYFLSVEASDENFGEKTRSFLEELGASEVWEVEE